MRPNTKKQPQSRWTTSSPSPRRKESQMIVRFIDTYFIEATQANFKSAVQSLTGKNSEVHQIPTSESTYHDSNDDLSAPQYTSLPANNFGWLQAADDGDFSKAGEDGAKMEVEGEDDMQMGLDFSEFEKIRGWTQNYSGDDTLLSPNNEHALGLSSLNFCEEETLVLWDLLWADEVRHNGDV